MKRLLINLSVLFALIICQTNYAKPAGSAFIISSNANAIYVNSTIPNHTYTQAGIKLNSSNYNLKYAGFECTMSSNGYCLFSVNDKQPTAITIIGPAGKINFTLCLNGSGPFSCQQYSVVRTAPKFAYVTNGGNDTVSLCSLNPNGSIVTCNAYPGFDAAGNNTFSFGGASGGSGITLNTEHTIAYITNYQNSTISICKVNSDGTFGVCSASNGNGTFQNPTGSIALNTKRKLAYIGNFASQTISICPINTDATFGTCTTFSGNGTFGIGPLQGPTQVMLNSAATLAFITTNANNISICPVNNDGSFGTCNVSNGNDTFLDTQGVSLDASESFIYVGNAGNNTISICPLSHNGSLGTCTASSGTPLFNFSSSSGICLFMGSITNMGYIPNNGNDMAYLCPINAINGSLGTCTTSTGSGTFNLPSAITLS